MKWQKKITKKQLKHIKATTSTGTLEQFKRNREQHKKWEEDGSIHGGGFACWECREIAVRLGIEA